MRRAPYVALHLVVVLGLLSVQAARATPYYSFEIDFGDASISLSIPSTLSEENYTDMMLSLTFTGDDGQYTYSPAPADFAKIEYDGDELEIKGSTDYGRFKLEVDFGSNEAELKIGKEYKYECEGCVAVVANPEPGTIIGLSTFALIGALFAWRRNKQAA